MAPRRLSFAVCAGLAALAAASGCSGGAAEKPSTKLELLRRMPSGSSLLWVPVGGAGAGQVSTPDVQLGWIGDDVFERADLRGVYWAYVATGTTVTLTATASGGSRFAGWYGGSCAGTGPCEVTLGGSVDVGAQFEREPAPVRSSFVLRVHVLSPYRNLHPSVTASPGTVSLGCSSGGKNVLDCAADVAAGTAVTLTAAGDPAQPEYLFQGWGGSCTGTGTCAVTLDRDVSVTAWFNTAGASQPSTACTVPNGSGARAWTGTSYGPCTVTACDAGFADCDVVASNGCETSLQTDAASCGTCGRVCPAVPNGAAACASGACGVATCASGFTLSGGGCVATTVSCPVAHGTGTQTWNGTTYGSCNATGCEAGYHVANGACEPDTVTCALPNGWGSQTWVGSAYTPCILAACTAGHGDCNSASADGCEVSLTTDVASCGACGRACPPVPNGTPACDAGTCGVAVCNPGYSLAGGSCVLTNVPCPVANGTGTRTWDGLAGTYGACNVASCNAGYHAFDNACAPDVIGCTVTNGTGTRTWNGSAYGACVVSACSTGYGDCDGSSADGCEANVHTDRNNCGSCGRVCPAVANGTPACSVGSCTAVCNAGYFLVGGSCVAAQGTVRHVNGAVAPVAYALCGSGTNTSCTQAAAEQSCTRIGRRLVSHASNGTSAIVSLGATQSCYWSVSYFVNNDASVAGQCLVAISNATWSGCCGLGAWHGNVLPVPAALGQQFGWVYSQDSGYVSSMTNATGTTWGCQATTSPPPSRAGCSRYYVACE